MPKREQPPALLILRQIPYAESRQEAERPQTGFPGSGAAAEGLAPAADLLDQDWDRMVSFYNYPKQQWQHLRTTRIQWSLPFRRASAANRCGQALQER